MLPFHFCSCFPCSHFRLDLITHSCVPLTFWSVTLITDLRSVYVTHPFVIRRLLATSPLCLSSASRLLYISDVNYKYSACWGDCPSVQISSWILPVNSPLFPSVLLCLLATPTFVRPPSLCLLVLRNTRTQVLQGRSTYAEAKVLNTSTSPPPVVDNPSHLSLLVSEFVGGTSSDSIPFSVGWYCSPRTWSILYH